jgi:hypothetical protein
MSCTTAMDVTATHVVAAFSGCCSGLWLKARPFPVRSNCLACLGLLAGILTRLAVAPASNVDA